MNATSTVSSAVRREPGPWRPTGSAGVGVTVVVPTRNEAGNVRPLLERIARATAGIDVEVMFVDDSDDATAATIRAAARSFDFPVRVIARPPHRRNGLGMAVVEGIAAAERPWVCVMDGDLQHPPEVVPQMVDRALATGATLVAASRLSDGGGTAGLSPFRRLVSVALAAASHLLFPRKIRALSDPLTGFFLVHRNAVDLARLRPEGFKILLEIVVRTPNLVVAELPFEFAERHAGRSKACTAEMVRLCRQMLRLGFEAYGPIVRFAFVGATGLATNVLAAAWFAEVLHLHYLVAIALATQVSTFGNFVGTDRWVFPERHARRGLALRRAAAFFAVSNVALLLRGPIVVTLVASAGLHYLAANAVSLLVLMAIRFAVSDRLIWRNPALAAVPSRGHLRKEA